MTGRVFTANCSRLVLVAGVLLSSRGIYAEQRATLEEITVTAQHREQLAGSVPVSIFTFGAEQLEQQRVTSIGNLNGLVPNLNIDSFPSNGQTLRLFIRGVGLTDTQITQDAAVGVYMNGVYIARSAGLAFDVADLERIEVLRGPQGTLYGRNTTGGAINLVTRKPTQGEWQFNQTLSAGNQDLFSAQTGLNVPLGDHTAARIGYFYEDVRGFTQNQGPGGSWGDRESQSARLDVSFQPNNTVSARYSFDYSSIEYFNNPAQAVLPRAPGDGLLAVIGGIAQQYVTYDDERIDELSTTTALLPTNVEIQGHALELNWTINRALSLRSITAWRELRDESYLDFASGASEGFRLDFNSATLGAASATSRLDIAANRPTLHHRQLSQEFHLLGSAGDSLDYLAGLYLFREKADEDIAPTRHIFSVAPFAGGTLYNLGSEYNSIENRAAAIFAQATWTPAALDERIHLTLGWRYSSDSREVDREVRDEFLVDLNTDVLNLLPPTQFTSNPKADFNDNSFTLVAQYDWSDDTNLYLKFAEAYKSGGFNIRDPDEVAFGEGFDEEKLRSLEAGFKGDLLARALRVNAAVFYQAFADYQYNFQLPGTIQGNRVFNIDGGELSGIELDITAVPMPGLLLQLGYAFLHSELDDITSPLTGESVSADFGFAPEHSWSAVADYTYSGLSFGVFNINLNYSFVDERDAQTENNVRDAYSLLNARVSLSQIRAWGGEWTVALWGKNLQDSDYESFALDNLPQAQRAVIWGDGLTWGADVTYRY